MKLFEAIEKFRYYWPDTKNVMWGDAFETICNRAMETNKSIQVSTLLKTVDLMM